MRPWFGFEKFWARGLAVRDNLLALLDEVDITQAELARRLGETEYWVSNRLTGRTDIKADEVERFAEAFRVRPEAVYRGTAAVREVAPPYLGSWERWEQLRPEDRELHHKITAALEEWCDATLRRRRRQPA